MPKGDNPLRGVAHPNWRGDEATYSSIHRWARDTFGKSGVCQVCGAEGRTDLCNVDHRYARVIEDWIELCRVCHVAHDVKNGLRDPREAATISAQRRLEKTHCKRGHSLADAYISSGGKRHCRACHRDRQRERRAAREAA